MQVLLAVILNSGSREERFRKRNEKITKKRKNKKKKNRKKVTNEKKLRK